MKTNKSVQKIFAAVAGGVLLTAALGLAPDIVRAEEPSTATEADADTLARQSEEIARFFEELNHLGSPIANEKFWGQNGLSRKMDERIHMMEKNRALITDRVFWAWEPLTRHWHSGVKDMAFRSLHLFNSTKKEYAQHTLQNQAKEWALSSDHRIRWRAGNTIYSVAERYPGLIPDAIDIVESQISSRNNEIKEDGAQNAEIIGKHQAASREDMLWLIKKLTESADERLQWVGLYHLENLASTFKPGEMDEDTAQSLFTTAEDVANVSNKYMALSLAMAVAEHAPKTFMKPLMAMGKKVLAIDLKGKDMSWLDGQDLKASGLRAVAMAGTHDPALFGEAYKTIVPYLQNDKQKFADTAMSMLSEMSVHSEKQAKRTANLIAPFLTSNNERLRMSALVNLGRLGEKYESLAKVPFDAAKPRITKGNSRYMRAYATGVIGAIGAAHPQFREEAAELVMGVAMTDKEDGTVRRLAFSELAAIGAANDEYAEKLFAWAKEQSLILDPYNMDYVGRMVEQIGLRNCDQPERARGVLKEQFGATIKIDEKYGNDDAEACRVQAKENPRESNLPLGGLMFSADDYSFR